MAKLITALDIGSANIKGLVVEIRKDGHYGVLTAFKERSAGIKKGAIVDFEEATHNFRSIILELKKISKKAVQNIFVGINNDRIKSRFSKGTTIVSRADQEIQQDDVERAIEAARAVKLSPNFMILQHLIRDFNVDEVGDIQDPVGMYGNRLEANLLLIEAFSPYINSLNRCLEKVGARIEGEIFNPLAAARSVLTKKQKELGVILIDFGFHTTSFVVYQDNKVVVAKSLPLGSIHLTNDLAVGLKIPVEAAEKIKLNYGYALSNDISRKEFLDLKTVDSSLSGQISKRFISEIIEVRLAEILGLINNELKNFDNKFQLPGGVVVVGGGTKLKGLTDLIKQELKLSAQIGVSDLSKFEVLNPVHYSLLEDPDFVVATGLILLAGDNLIPKINGHPIIKFIKSLFP